MKCAKGELRNEFLENSHFTEISLGGGKECDLRRKKALGRNYFSGDPLNPSGELMCRFVIL